MAAAIDARLRFEAGGVPLEGHLRVPEQPARAVVVCHPHPQYGGNMDNNVVVGVADALRAAGVATLRFNFRGVGGSGGRHGGGAEEVRDVEAAVAELGRRVPDVPVTLIGYSFGAAVGLRAGYRGLPGVRGLVGIAPPLAMLDMTFLADATLPVCLVAGDGDSFCGTRELQALAARIADASVAVIEGADHFFAGDEVRVAEPVCRFVLGADV